LSNSDSFEWFQRDKWQVTKFDDFQATIEKSQKECADLARMSDLFFILGSAVPAFFKIPSFFENGYVSERYSQSLVFTCFIESLRNSYCTIYLSECGLYKNAYHNIRYVLESIIQASYFDSHCPNDDFPMKIAMLEEVQDKKGYGCYGLIKKLHIDQDYKKEAIKTVEKEYGKLSKKVHSKHNQFVATSYNFMDRAYKAVYVDCEEVTRIYDSMKAMFDVFFLLFFTHFPELKKILLDNEEFVETIKSHNLNLSSKILRT
jgi:hypothetical protein